MKNLKAKNQKGFSLVELLVVIAIIAILAAVAIPMYQNYTTRARVANEISAVGGLKADISTLISTKDEVPESYNNISRPDNAAYDNSGNISVSVDAIGQATDNPRNGPAFVKITPTKGSGSITWACTASGLTQSQLPAGCSAVTSGSVQVTQMS